LAATKVEASERGPQHPCWDVAEKQQTQAENWEKLVWLSSDLKRSGIIYGRSIKHASAMASHMRSNRLLIAVVTAGMVKFQTQARPTETHPESGNHPDSGNLPDSFQQMPNEARGVATVLGAWTTLTYTNASVWGGAGVLGQPLSWRQKRCVPQIMLANTLCTKHGPDSCVAYSGCSIIGPLWLLHHRTSLVAPSTNLSGCSITGPLSREKRYRFVPCLKMMVLTMVMSMRMLFGSCCRGVETLSSATKDAIVSDSKPVDHFVLQCQASVTLFAAA
jgi:hypothetical protein